MRAMWKGVIHLGDESVPVKLYSAIEDRRIHFRLVHREDHAPVKRAIVNPQTDEIVPYKETHRAWISDEGHRVLLDEDDLNELEPEASRDIEVLYFLPEAEIDHRWYDRPYFLGPDGNEEAWASLATALAGTGKEALVRWVMRNKQYVGALRLHEGCPLLVSLRTKEEVLPAESLEAPKGASLDSKELEMARQLVGMLAEDFDPDQFENDYRKRVRELIQAKAEGKTVARVPTRRKKKAADVSDALEASLAALKKTA